MAWGDIVFPHDLSHSVNELVEKQPIVRYARAQNFYRIVEDCKENKSREEIYGVTARASGLFIATYNNAATQTSFNLSVVLPPLPSRLLGAMITVHDEC